MSTPVPHYSPLISRADGHEERLLRVESTVQNMVGQMSEVVTKQDFLVQQLNDATERISSQMERGFSAVRNEYEKTQQKIESHEERLDAQLSRIEPLERAEKAAIAKADAVKKVMWAGIIAATGAGATKLIEILNRMFQ